MHNPDANPTPPSAPVAWSDGRDDCCMMTKEESPSRGEARGDSQQRRYRRLQTYQGENTTVAPERVAMKQAGKTLIATEPPQDKPWRETIIPPRLNGAGLDVYAFRVYVHLTDEWQQYENDQMSVGDIAAATGISLSRTRTAVRELVRRNMVIREDVEGWPPVFTLTSSRGWRA